jgi:hypothetical protein
MKMIAHQAPCNGFGNWIDIFLIKPQEIFIIGLFPEQRFPIDPTIINMVILAMLERYDLLHILFI